MEARAELKYVRISPRKVKIVLDLIRNKKCVEAMAILKHTPKSASEPLLKLLKSAMANAENNHEMDLSSCFISE
jgi:large subunit ribosomal protein L22